MSFYNMLFGVNPLSEMFLASLGVTRDEIPRFRDVYVTEDGRIAIYTRTGGGNRARYECLESCQDNYPQYFEDLDEGETPPSGPWNADLRKLDGFLYDKDDDFDCTFATFFYKMPTELEAYVKKTQELFGTDTPQDKLLSLMDLMKNKDLENPKVRHALEVAEGILKPLLENLTKDEGTK